MLLARETLLRSKEAWWVIHMAIRPYGVAHPS
jgi:hypothetical protein